MMKVDRKAVWMQERKKNYIYALVSLLVACTVEMFSAFLPLKMPLFWTSLLFGLSLAGGTFIFGVCLAFDAVLDVPNKLTVSWETLVGKHE